MIKITKDGITKFVPEKELQRFTDLGFKKAEQHKPEPMVIEETKEQQKETKTKTK